MATLAFGDYRPDISNLDGTALVTLLNVVPRADGYGPWFSLEALTQALPAPCRGYFYARVMSDGTVVIFAGTSTDLYMLNNTTLAWELVSKSGGPYTELETGANWQFDQFNNYVIAVQANADPQAFIIGTDVEFDDLGGSPPRAAHISIVNRFVMLSHLTSFPNRAQWSGLNAPTVWTAGTNSSDFQDLPDGGILRAIVGGEFGLMLQDASIRRMTFSPGSETIFDIQRLAEDVGLMAPYSVASAGDRVFFLSAKGFMMATGTGEPLPIGEEFVNRTFFADWDADAPQFMIGVASPKRNIVLFVYKSQGSSGEHFDKGLIYNYVLQKWSPIAIEGQYAVSLAPPGLTMEGLDAVAPGAATISNAADNGSGLIRLTVSSTSGWTTGDWKTISGVEGTTEANDTWQITVINGTTIDLQGSTFSNAYVDGGLVAGSLDEMEGSLDAIAASSLPDLSACDTSGAVSMFSGPPAEAILESTEQSGDGRRLLVRGFTPLTDAGEVYGSLAMRENLNADPTYSAESQMDTGRGFCPILWSTRYAAGRIRIPAGVNWTYARGIRPDVMLQGRI